MATLNLDPSVELTIEGVFTGNSFDFVVEQYDESDTATVDFEGAIKMVICYDPAFKKVATRLTEGDGITKNGYQIAISRTRIANSLPANTYFFQLYSLISGTLSDIILTGTITENPANIS